MKFNAMFLEASMIMTNKATSWISANGKQLCKHRRKHEIERNQTYYRERAKAASV